MSHKIGSTYFVVAFDTDVYGRDGRDDINLNKGKLTEVIVLESYNKSVLVAAPWCQACEMLRTRRIHDLKVAMCI